MAIYLYKAWDKNGNIVKGKLHSNNEDETIIFLKENSLTPINIKRSNIFNTDIKDLDIFRKRQTLSKKEVAFFCRQMCFVINSGITMSLGIEVIEKQCESKLLKEELVHIKEGILKGNSLEQCMSTSDKFPWLLCNMVKIGEESGRLSTIMEQMESHYIKEANTLEDIKSALLYPTFVLISMLVVILISLVYLIPNFSVIFLTQDIPLPLPTRILINCSNFLKYNYLWIVVFIGISIIVCSYINKNANFKSYKDKLIFSVPIVKKYFNLMISFRFSKSMSIMLEAGVPLLKALNITKKLSKNNEFKLVLESIHQEVKKGESLNIAMVKSNFFNIVLINMVNIGEESGRLSESLHKSAEYFEKEMSIAISRMKKMIEPVITIIIGVILGFIMLAIMLPTFYLTNAI